MLTTFCTQLMLKTSCSLYAQVAGENSSLLERPADMQTSRSAAVRAGGVVHVKQTILCNRKSCGCCLAARRRIVCLKNYETMIASRKTQRPTELIFNENDKPQLFYSVSAGVRGQHNCVSAKAASPSLGYRACGNTLINH